MRVLFLTLYPEVAASPRLRVTQFVPFLAQNGIECTVQSPITAAELKNLTGPGRAARPLWYHLRETPRRVAQILAANRYDLVFVQKAVMTAYVRGLGDLLRARARRLVYDIDDAVHLEPPHPLAGPWKILEDRAQILKLMKTADLVLAGNGWLADVARASGANVQLFPTVVDTERFVPRAALPNEFCIGWVGNPSTTICLNPAAEALETVRARLCLVGGDPARIPWLSKVGDFELRPWSAENEVADLHRFTVGIMPQPDAPWMRGKCALKAIQYMACGIPCVASAFGAAQDIIRHDENGLLADTTDAWLEAFERLRDPALCKRLGDAGRRTVEERFSLKKAAPRLLQLLREAAA